MRIGKHVECVSEQGAALLDAARAAGLDADVPTCPGWTVRSLLGHVGTVHRWATTFVRDGMAATAGGTHSRTAEAPADGLEEWFAEGHHALVTALTEAAPDLDCWTFLPAPSPLAFWARRQAHETAIHRADAESGLGNIPTYEPALAADGIDEMIAGFMARNGGRLTADPPVSLAVRPTDFGASWHVLIRPDGRTVSSPAAAPADCTLSGTASELYLSLWNRPPAKQPAVEGDSAVLDLWRAEAQIGWR